VSFGERRAEDCPHLRGETRVSLAQCFPCEHHCLNYTCPSTRYRKDVSPLTEREFTDGNEENGKERTHRPTASAVVSARVLSRVLLALSALTTPACTPVALPPPLIASSASQSRFLPLGRIRQWLVLAAGMLRVVWRPLRPFLRRVGGRGGRS
jgi:hypothetical protein